MWKEAFEKAGRERHAYFSVHRIFYMSHWCHVVVVLFRPEVERLI
ncbi:MAG: hypothetical protein ACE5EA_04135 [Nitrospirota bacterium]